MLRFLLRLALGVLALYALLISASAQMVQVSDNELIGTADLILIGTVKSVATVPNVPYWQAGQAMLTVEKILSPVPAQQGAKLDTLTLRYPLPPIAPPGMIIIDGGGMSLHAGQQQLFFLQRDQAGWTIVGGSEGKRNVADADKFAEKIKAYSLSVALVGPSGPFYFGKNVAVKMRVTNSGDEPIQIAAANLEGFYCSARIGANVPFSNAQQQLLRPAVKNELSGLFAPLPPQVVKAHETLDMSVMIVCAAPTDWGLLSPDTYVQTAVTLRARICVQHANITNADTTPSWFAASAWQTVMVGYAPPAE